MLVSTARFGASRAIQPSDSSRVKWLGRAPQRVDDPHVEIGQCREALIGNRVEIRRIGNVGDAEAQRVDAAVLHLERQCRDDAARAVDLDGLAGFEPVEFQDRRIVAAGGGVDS